MYRILDEHNKMSPRWENEFYQWDSDRKLVVLDASVEEVHFTNRTMENALVKTVYKDEETGYRLVDVPNILFQSYKAILVYGYDKDSKCTTGRTVFKVNKRKKPDDYVYTETEVFKYSELEERIAQLEEKEVEVDLSEYYTKDETEEFVKQTVAENIEDVTDGISPLITVTDITGGHRVTITDAEGEKSFDVMDGKDGEGGSGGVQPDWNQNDESQPDYVKNRTHWLERPYEPIVWDGSTEGRDSVDVSLAMGSPAGSFVVYKVSDHTLTEEDVATRSVYALDHDGTSWKCAWDYFYDASSTTEAVPEGFVKTGVLDATGDNDGTLNLIVFVFFAAGDYSDSAGIVIPSTGTYFGDFNNSDYTSIEINNDVWHTLDKKYIPDTYATKEYVDNLITGAIGGSY